jgi:hypothetical protein
MRSTGLLRITLRQINLAFLLQEEPSEIYETEREREREREIVREAGRWE